MLKSLVRPALRESVKVPVLPLQDEADFDSALGREPLPLEDQYFGIVYEDSGGFESSRAIIAKRIKFNTEGMPLLCAHCCERDAYREFRADRIIECWDAATGECFEAHGFLLETLGFDIRSRAIAEQVCQEKMVEIFDIARPHILVLGALSKCDRYMHHSEVAVAVSHVARLVAWLAPSDDELARVETRVRRVRPSNERLNEALDELRSRSPNEVTELVVAAVKLVKADGKLKPQELDMLDELASELLGLSVSDLVQA